MLAIEDVVGRYVHEAQAVLARRRRHAGWPLAVDGERASHLALGSLDIVVGGGVEDDPVAALGEPLYRGRDRAYVAHVDVRMPVPGDVRASLVPESDQRGTEHARAPEHQHARLVHERSSYHVCRQAANSSVPCLIFRHHHSLSRYQRMVSRNPASNPTCGVQPSDASFEQSSE